MLLIALNDCFFIDVKIVTIISFIVLFTRGGYWYRKSYCDVLRYVTPYHDSYHAILGLLVCFVL